MLQKKKKTETWITWCKGPFATGEYHFVTNTMAHHKQHLEQISYMIFCVKQSIKLLTQSVRAIVYNHEFHGGRSWPNKKLKVNNLELTFYFLGQSRALNHLPHGMLLALQSSSHRNHALEIKMYLIIVLSINIYVYVLWLS